MDARRTSETCPKCESSSLGQGRQSGYSQMQPTEGVLGSPIIYTICTNCGFILEGYVTKPHRFKKR